MVTTSSKVNLIKFVSIASISPNRGIGLNNKLINFNTEDMSLFKAQTKGQVVVMGKNTFLSLKKPLVDRLNVVLSNTLSMDDIPIPDRDRVLILRNYNADKDSILNYIDTNKYSKVFIIGGEAIYNLFKEKVDEHLISEFPEDKEADSYYPSIDTNKYKLMMTTYYINFKLKRYDRI